MSSCQFLRPDWLWLLLPLALLLWILTRRHSQAGNWRSVCDSQLLPYILQGREAKSGYWPLLATGLAGLLAIIALGGPACEQREQPVFRDQSALVIALDLSRSMDATDIKPSRLVRARLKLIDILKQRREGQTALIVYAAQAFTVSPLTDDTNTIISLVGSLDSNMMPQQGSDSSVAVAKAAQLLQQAGVPRGDILLITDGVNDSNMQATLNEIGSYQHRVSVLSVGSPAGAPVALPDGGFLKNKSGAIVIPKLIEAPLQQLAQQGNGRYHRISADDTDIDYLLNIVHNEGEQEEAIKGLKTDQWYEEGPWLLLLLLPLAAMAFRRGYLSIAVLLIMPMPDDAYALDLQQLWLNQNQQAQQQLQQGNAEQAAELFNDPAWKAAAHYRAGQYQQSIEALQGLDTADALYNKANALARMNKFQEAIETYDEALKLQSNHEDAQYNRDLLKQQMQNQPQQNQEQSQENKSEQNQQNRDQQQQSEGQQGQGQEQQNKQQSSEQQNQSQQNNQQQQAQQQSGQNTDKDTAEQHMNRQQDSEGEKDTAEQQQARAEQKDNQTSENDIATEQWLRRIPDDPGGLMRRKFQYQYQQQSQQHNSEIEPW